MMTYPTIRRRQPGTIVPKRVATGMGFVILVAGIRIFLSFMSLSLLSGEEKEMIFESSLQHEHVTWSYDEQWFQSQRDLGCCKPAITIYERYETVNHRCCTHRLDDIVPFRPVGGMGWKDWSNNMRQRNHRNISSIHFVGDSLGEQHFVSLLCLAWATNGLGVSTPTFTHSQPNLGPKNGAHIKGASWKATIDPLNVTISFVRAPVPELSDYVNYTDSDVLIVGGWHFGGTSKKGLNTYLEELGQLRPNQLTLIAQALPVHFPGGRYRNDGIYPIASGVVQDIDSALSHTDDADVTRIRAIVANFERGRNSSHDLVCDTISKYPSQPDINDMLDDLLLARHNNKTTTISSAASSASSLLSSPSFEIIQFAGLLSHRGDANIGPIQKNTLGLRKGSRDCLHYCVAPGILDALARETLLTMSVASSKQRS